MATPGAAMGTVSLAQVLGDLGQAEPPRLWDVRSAGEWSATHCTWATHVPLPAIKQHAAELVQLCPGPIVVFCESGQRARQAAQALRDAGAAQVLILDDGNAGFAQSNAPMKSGQPIWSMERQVRLVAGLLVLLGCLGSLIAPGALILAGFIGAGLTFSAATNTCGMARLLALLPHNRRATEPSWAQLATRLRQPPTRPYWAEAEPPRANPSS